VGPPWITFVGPTHIKCNNEEGTKRRENPNASTTLIKQIGNPGQTMKLRAVPWKQIEANNN